MMQTTHYYRIAAAVKNAKMSAPERVKLGEAIAKQFMLADADKFNSVNFLQRCGLAFSVTVRSV